MIALFELTYEHQLHAFELHFIHLLRKYIDYSKEKKRSKRYFSPVLGQETKLTNFLLSTMRD